MAETSFEIERSAQIAAPAERIYPLIADFRRWTEWSPWEGLDPDLKREYSGAESGTGANYAWSGNRKAGEGSMAITGTDQPNRLEIDLHFIKPFKADNLTVFELAERDGGTEVKWRMSGTRSSGQRLFSKLLRMDNYLRGEFDKGLAKLKEIAEQ